MWQDFSESKSSKFSLFIRGNFFIWGLKALSDVVGNYSKSEFSSKGARWHTFDASCIQQHYNCKCCLSPKLSRTESTAKRLAADESTLNPVSDRALLIPSRPCRTRSDQPRVLAHLVSTLDAVTDAVGGTADIRALIAALISAADNDLHPPCPSSRPPGPGSTARTARTSVSDTTPYGPTRRVAPRPGAARRHQSPCERRRRAPSTALLPFCCWRRSSNRCRRARWPDSASPRGAMLREGGSCGREMF